jgi:hypothetical protein
VKGWIHEDKVAALYIVPSGIASFPWNDSKRRSFFPEHLPHVGDKEFWLFVRRKMSAAVVLRFRHNIAQQFLPPDTELISILI